MRKKFSSVALLLSLAMVVMLVTGCPIPGPNGDEGEGEGEGEVVEGEGEGEVVVEGEGEGEVVVEGEGEGEVVVEGEGEGEEEGEEEGEPVAKIYVGSATCAGCHPGVNAEYELSGHPYKINKVVNGEPPLYPYPTLKAIDNINVPDVPDIDGLSWDGISYVIGGYGWKARFMDSDGYILTDFTGDDQGTRLTQYNLPEDSPARWVSYSPHDGGTKPYTCGECHTTGWVAATSADIENYDNNKEPFQDGLPGIHGKWSEPGVRCEACHGPGSEHAAAPSTTNIDRIVTDAEDNLESRRCGECHFRDTNHRILTSKGFIRHHEQYDEMLASPHGPNGEDMSCITCHDPHQPTKFAPELGIVKSCSTMGCHDTVTIERGSMSGLECIDCHMPRASKSAVKFSDYEGDVKTHIFAINSDAVLAADAMFTTDGETAIVATDENGMAKVTLDFACMRCHSEAGGYSIQTLEKLSEVAKLIHGTK